MKRLICLLLSIFILCSLTACNSEKEEKKESYETALDDYIAYVTGKASKATVEGMYPQEVWDYYQEYEYWDEDEMFDDVMDGMEDMAESMKEYYGDNFKVSFKVEGKEKLDDDDLDEIKDELSYYDVDESSVKKAYELEVTMVIKGSEDKEENESSMIVVQIGSKWYIYDLIVNGVLCH